MIVMQPPSSVGEETQFQRIKTKALPAKTKLKQILMPEWPLRCAAGRCQAICFAEALPVAPAEDVAQRAEVV